MDRWEALVRFDDEVREAAEKLRPFGLAFVDELGEAFMALREDRKYLPNIVRGLAEKARQIEAERLRAESERAISALRETQRGEDIVPETLDILLRAVTEHGYVILVQEDKTFVLSKGTSKEYLRSNADIRRFGGFPAKEQQSL